MTHKNKKSITNYCLGISSSISLTLFLVSGVMAFQLSNHSANPANAAEFRNLPVGQNEIIDIVNNYFRFGFVLSIIISIIFAGITLLFLVNYKKLIHDGGEL